MLNIILGNIFCGVAVGCDMFSGTRKTQKGVILVQTVSQIFYSLSNLVLSAYSALVQGFVSMFRNFLTIQKKRMYWLEIILCLIALGLGTYFNLAYAKTTKDIIVGFIPVLANFTYTLTLLLVKDNVIFVKLSFLFTVFCYIIFNYFIYNYVGVIGNFITFITIIIFVVKYKKGTKNEQDKQGTNK